MRARGWSTTIGLGLVGVTGSARADFNLPDPDVTPPIVAIVAPMPEQAFPTGAPVMVEVEADDPRPQSSGVAEVWLVVDGEARLDVLDEIPPWTFSLELAPGSHEVRALARDWEGNEAASDAVTFSIDAPAGQDDSGSGGSGGTGGGAGSSSSGASPGDGTSSGGTNAEAEPLDRGCACQSSRGRHGAPISALLVLVLGCLRRSTRRRSRTTESGSYVPGV
jgi:uncharacterized membrane protein YgcG